MKSLIALFDCILSESGILCGTSTLRDSETVHARVEHEGLSFLTIALPMYCRDFERSLDLGYIESTSFRGYGRMGSSPKFLGGLISLVFDRKTGVLLDNPSIDAIQAIRQICLLYSKVSLPCSPAREAQAFRSYIECESEVAAWSWNNQESMSDFHRVSQLLFASVFSAMEYDVQYSLLIPRHGPGATADNIRGNEKYVPRYWHTRLDPYFPASDFLIGSYRSWEDLDGVDFIEPADELPVKVISVPKTLKTPRIIAMEPLAMQYAQQALLRSFKDAVSSSPVLTRMLNPNDQTPNQVSARIGSTDGSLATLDLSEASDRVSNLHVQYLLLTHPHLDGAVQACRSRRADVPGYGIVSLTKFASMGSALTFPFESCVFLTCIFMGIEKSLGRRVTRSDVLRLSSSVRVFGDDIVVPKHYVSDVVDSLEANGFRVNLGKSFWNGKFRESCGKEYYDGEDVTVARCRRILPSPHQPRSAETVSLVSFRNHLYERGFWKTSAYCDRLVRKVLPFYPVVSESSGLVGRRSFLGYEVQRIGGPYQSPLVKGYTVKARLPSSYLDDDPALLKIFLRMQNPNNRLQTVRGSDLQRAGRPLDVALYPRWSSPF